MNTKRDDLKSWEYVIVCKDDPTNLLVDLTVIQESPQFSELAFTAAIEKINFGLVDDSFPPGQSWISQYKLEFSKGPCGEIELDKALVSRVRVDMHVYIFIYLTASQVILVS